MHSALLDAVVASDYPVTAAVVDVLLHLLKHVRLLKIEREASFYETLPDPKMLAWVGQQALDQGAVPASSQLPAKTSMRIIINMRQHASRAGLACCLPGRRHQRSFSPARPSCSDATTLMICDGLQRF